MRAFEINEVNISGIATKEEAEAWCATHKIGDKMPPNIEAYAQAKIKEKTEFFEMLSKEHKAINSD